MGQELLYTDPDTMVVWSIPRDASEMMMQFCCADNQLADIEERISYAFPHVSDFMM